MQNKKLLIKQNSGYAYQNSESRAIKGALSRLEQTIILKFNEFLNDFIKISFSCFLRIALIFTRWKLFDAYDKLMVKIKSPQCLRLLLGLYKKKKGAYGLVINYII